MDLSADSFLVVALPAPPSMRSAIPSATRDLWFLPLRGTLVASAMGPWSPQLWDLSRLRYGAVVASATCNVSVGVGDVENEIDGASRSDFNVLDEK